GSCQRNPETTPANRFFQTHYPRIAMQQAKIEQQHQGNKEVEANPEIERGLHYQIRVSELLLASASTALPLLPKTKCLQLLIQFCFAHEIFNLCTILSRSEALRQIGDRKRQVTGQSDMLLELRDIDLVECIGAGV